MISTTELHIVNFFIFNPKFGQTESEEHKKILFYHPQETNNDIQLRSAGLCEALIKFTESFKPDKPCQSFHTKNTKQFLYEAEKDFWLVMTLGVPINSKASEKGNDEDCGSLIQENVFEAVLKKCYRVYRLFCGTFSSTLGSTYDEDSLNLLKCKLDNFFTKYLTDLKLVNCDILDVFQGISFLPLGKEPFLHVKSFINLIENKFVAVKYSTFLYNDQLIWSGINSDDMQIIYQFLTMPQLPYFDLDSQFASSPKETNSYVYNLNTSKAKCLDTKDFIEAVHKVPKIYLTSHNNSENLEIYYLLIYRTLSSTLCLFISEQDSLSLELLKNMDSYIRPTLKTIVAEVAEHCLSCTMPLLDEGGPKVLYFNKLNLAQKSTMHVQNKKDGRAVVPGDMLRIISELNAEKSKSNACGEVMLLTLNDCWLVGRYSNSREFYAVFTQKRGSLIDITDEVKKICDNQLKGIFFCE